MGIAFKVVTVIYEIFIVMHWSALSGISLSSVMYDIIIIVTVSSVDQMNK